MIIFLVKVLLYNCFRPLSLSLLTCSVPVDSSVDGLARTVVSTVGSFIAERLSNSAVSPVI